MKIKVSEAAGPTLDWLVAKADGDLYPKGNVRLLDGKLFSITPGDHETRDFWHSYKPTTNWSQGGPIIEREGLELSVHVIHNGAITSWASEKEWPSTPQRGAIGPTPLIAAMRCFVVSRLGNEVEVPDQLSK